MIRRPPRSTQSRSSAASDVYKRQLDAELLVDDVELLALAADGVGGAGVEAHMATRAGVLGDRVADQRAAHLGRAAALDHVGHHLVAEVPQRGEHGVGGAAAELAE